MTDTQIDTIRSFKNFLAHLERTAFIYVRQSTLKQVINNKESQENQYRFNNEHYHWAGPLERIRVIDSDLGKSGSEATGEQVFKKWLPNISLRRAGIVFGYEVSRLARNNQDWYHLWILRPFLIHLSPTMMGFMIQAL